MDPAFGAVRAVLRALRSENEAKDDKSGPVVVDRACCAGTMARRTFSQGDPASVTAFLNTDLQFGVYEAPAALSQLESVLHAQLNALSHTGSADPASALTGWEVRVLDPECRGGLWAEVRCQSSRASQPEAQGSPTPITVKVYVTENMSKSVVPATAPPAALAAAAAAASGAGASTDADLYGELYDNLDQQKAAEQQASVLAAAEGRQKREERRRARHEKRQQQHQQQHGQEHEHGHEQAGAAGHQHGGSSPTATGAGTPARSVGADPTIAVLSGGLEEARCLFWSSQPKAALAAARQTHVAWRAAYGKHTTGAVQSSDPEAVLLLLDVLALHAYQMQEVEAAAGGGGAGMADDAAAVSGVVRRVFTMLANAAELAEGGGAGGGEGEGTRMWSVALPGGLLAGVEWAGGGHHEAGAGGGALRVEDPCAPFLDLYGVACAAVAAGGAGPVGAVGAGGSGEAGAEGREVAAPAGPSDVAGAVVLGRVARLALEAIEGAGAR